MALLIIILFFNSTKHEGEGKSLKEVFNSFIKVISNVRLLTLILIVSGFWIVQHQLYATMPKYVTRLAGDGAAISWYANVNPLVVVLTVTLITRLMSTKSPLFSMIIGMFIMPVSALIMASGNLFEKTDIDLGIIQMHPIALMMVIGIGIQGLAESFISPRFLQFFSLHSPKGEEGLYLGFSHLHSFFSSILGFGLSGFLLNKYCPDPNLFSNHNEWLSASANAHYIWYYFVIISIFSALALITFGVITKQIDKRRTSLK